MAQFDLFVCTAAFSLTFLLYIRRSYSRRLPLPPGPKKLPFIGNLLDMPAKTPWITYHKWCKQFGSDIIQLSVGGHTLVILDTVETSIDLLEKRSSIYSGRARMPMLNELMGWDYMFGLMPYGDRWREHRKLMHHALHPAAAAHFQPQELRAARGLVRRLLGGSDNVMSDFRLMAGETIMAVTYGIEVLPKDDPYIAAAERGLASLAPAATPGGFLVDSIPVLKYLPEWTPFAGFKRLARECKKLALEFAEIPFEGAKRQIANGDTTPSFVLECLERIDESKDMKHQESLIKSVAATMYLGGADTTVSSIGTCVLGLLANPEALKKAQQEIDSVIGDDRLPDFNDEKSLPYISAIVKEAIRWKEVAPTAIPHLLSVDDEYNGYRIPAGSLVIANSWSMLHDERVYPDPFSFNPDRFIKDGKLNPEIRDPAVAAFGFGRRICPGRYMALSAIWITAASLIAAFDITKDVDENGKIIEPTYEYHTDFLCSPLPFKCTFTPRSKKIEQLLRASVSE